MELKCSFISYLVLNLDQWRISEGSVGFLKTVIKYYDVKLVATLYLLKEFSIWAPQKTHQETYVVLSKYGKNLSENLQNTTVFYKYRIFHLTAFWTTTVSLQKL